MFYCVIFFNFLNSDQRVSMNSKRIKVIFKWFILLSIRKIWGFYDLINFYKRFVLYFFIFVVSLIELVRNYVFLWEDVQEMGFQILFYFNILNFINIYVFVFFTGVEEKSSAF